MSKGRKRSIFMLGLGVPLFSSALLFVGQFIFGRQVNLGLGIVAGASLLLIVAVGSTIPESPGADT